MRRKKAFIFGLIKCVVLCAIAVIFLYPFAFMVLKSFDKTANFGMRFPPSMLPEKFGVNNYSYVFASVPIWSYYFNTIYTAFWVTMLHLTTGALGGYALAKGRFRFKSFWLLFILSTMMIPFEATVLTRFLMFKDMGLVDTYLGLILPSISYPFGVFLTKQYVENIPDSFGESARIDGAGEFRIFFRIYLPLIGPILATLAILSVLGEWNKVLWPLLMLNDPGKYTISLGIAFFKQEGNSSYVGNSMAVVTLSTIPLLSVFLCLQKYIIQSVALSGVKE